MSRTVVFHANAYHISKGRGNLKIKNTNIQYENELDPQTKLEILKLILGQTQTVSGKIKKPIGVALYCLRTTSTTGTDTIYGGMNAFSGEAGYNSGDGTQANLSSANYTQSSWTDDAYAKSHGYLRKFGRILLPWNVSSGKYTAGGTEQTPLGHMLVAREGASSSEFLKASKFDICFSNIRHGYVGQTKLIEHFAGWSDGWIDMTGTTNPWHSTASNTTYENNMMHIDGNGTNIPLDADQFLSTSEAKDAYMLKNNQYGILIGAYLVKGELRDSATASDRAGFDKTVNIDFSDNTADGTITGDVSDRGKYIFSGKTIIPTTNTTTTSSVFDTTDTIRGKYTLDFTSSSGYIGYGQSAEVELDGFGTGGGFNSMVKPKWSTLLARQYYPANTASSTVTPWERDSQTDADDNAGIERSADVLEDHFTSRIFDGINDEFCPVNDAGIAVDKWAIADTSYNIVAVVENSAVNWAEETSGTVNTGVTTQLAREPRLTAVIDFGNNITATNLNPYLYGYTNEGHGTTVSTNGSKVNTNEGSKWIIRIQFHSTEAFADTNGTAVGSVGGSSNNWSPGNTLKINVSICFQAKPE